MKNFLKISPSSIICTGFLAFAAFFSFTGLWAQEPATIRLKTFTDQNEVERMIRQIQPFGATRRIEFVSRYLSGRKYRPETKTRIKKQNAKKVEKREANNAAPLPVDFLRTSMRYLDCMTYVEHVLAISSSRKPEYQKEFLCHLVNIMFNANGEPLQNHLRNHFTSHWADINEKKGYLINVARNHPHAVCRKLFLNRVGTNRTFYVEDSFMIAANPQSQWYFPLETVMAKKTGLQSGDIVALVTDKEGLDVTHMGFFIKKAGKDWLRHASIKLNRIVDQEFYQYLREHKTVKGLMVMRPILKAKNPAPYLFLATEASR